MLPYSLQSTWLRLLEYAPNTQQTCSLDAHHIGQKMERLHFLHRPVALESLDNSRQSTYQQI